ncbi:MAG: hypothetical protein KDD44_15305, partial [Bdellovibrionales bacterium]|nr:hypothetical protein [Bdellovibrionales bacterium]
SAQGQSGQGVSSAGQGSYGFPSTIQHLSVPVAGPNGTSALSLQVLSEKNHSIAVISPQGTVVETLPLSSYSVADSSGDHFGSIVSVSTADGIKTFGDILNQSASEPYFVHIAPNATPSAAASHLISRISGADLQLPGTCGDDQHAGQLIQQLLGSGAQQFGSGSASGSVSAQSSLRTMKLIVSSSGEFTGSRSDTEVVAQVVSTVDAANLYFQTLGLEIDLVGVQIYRQGQGDPYASATQQQDAFQMLQAVRNLWSGRRIPAHDMVAVFGRGLFGNVFGLAYTATSCLSPDFSVLFATQGGNSATAQLGLASTLAHEVGHIIGMNHDTTIYPEGASVMWPYFV